MSEAMICIWILLGVLSVWCVAITAYVQKQHDEIESFKFWNKDLRESVLRAEEAFAKLGLTWKTESAGWVEVEAQDAKG